MVKTNERYAKHQPPCKYEGGRPAGRATQTGAREKLLATKFERVKVATFIIVLLFTNTINQS